MLVILKLTKQRLLKIGSDNWERGEEDIIPSFLSWCSVENACIIALWPF